MCDMGWTDGSGVLPTAGISQPGGLQGTVYSLHALLEFGHVEGTRSVVVCFGGGVAGRVRTRGGDVGTGARPSTYP